MTFSTTRPTHPATKLLFAATVAALALLGSVALVALSGQGSVAVADDPSRVVAMRATADAVFEVDVARFEADGSGSPLTERRAGRILTVSIDGDRPSHRLDADERRLRRIEERETSRPTSDLTVRTTVAPVPTTAPGTTRAPETTTVPKRTGPSATTGTSPATTASPATTGTSPATTASSTTVTSNPAPPPVPGPDQYRVTVGSGGATAFDSSSPPGDVSAHGTRIYCVISHFSHDDPVVFPRRPGASHAHMYWGNTEADAGSTGDSLMRSGNSSCEGGITNRSSYWMPAFFNSADEVVLPESVFVYYKSFGGPGFDRSTIKPIPAGLEMLATRDIRGAGDWDFRVGGNGNGTELKLLFPSCIAIDGDGRPVLTSEDNIAHLAYATEHGSPSGCPASHPYRIPTLSYIVRFAVPFSSDWYLASDRSSATKGQSLHADYVAAWDDGTMAQLVECTIRARRSCEFPGRDQLPERFFAPDGTRLYRYSVTLDQHADRTPFGTRIKRFAP